MEGSLRARDGTRLAVTLWGAGEEPRPAVVVRTPYGRTRFGVPPWTRLADAGYALVAVDVRGRGDSDGSWRPWVDDGYDGYDVIEWVADQPWCDGNVATIGGSYDAMTQWWAAARQPPHLRCMIPMAVGAQRETTFPFGRSNGVVMPYWLWWLKFLETVTTGSTEIDWPAVLAVAPQDMARSAGVSEEPWAAYLAGAIGYGERTWAVDPRDIQTPALVTNGLWDDPKTFSWWTQLAQSPAAAHHRLLAGAWDHAGNSAPRPVLGGVDVSGAAIDPVDHWLAFLDRWMRGGSADRPAVTICRSGTWEWETLPAWPPPGEPRSFDLGGGSWRHDPAEPLWLGGGKDLAFADAPLDPAVLDARDDVLVLDLPPAAGALRVSGEPVVEATVSQAGPGTVVAWLSDIAPDGSGIRFGVWPSPAYHPGGTVAVRLVLPAVHHEVASGHRLRVSLAASFAPVYAHARQAQQVTVTNAVLHACVEDR